MIERNIGKNEKFIIIKDNHSLSTKINTFMYNENNITII